MPENREATRILTIVDPGATQQQIAVALENQPEFALVNTLYSTERLAREVFTADPDVILVDYQLKGQSTLDIIDELALQFPEVSIIAMLNQDDPLLAQQFILAGARAFVIQPFTQINLLSTLRRVHDLDSRRVQTQVSKGTGSLDTVRPLRTFAVFSPRGGVGVSTIAANLALALYEETGENVLLLEGKLFFGHLDVMLNIRTQNSIADLIPHASALDEGLVRDVVFTHASGVHVLLAPNNLQVAQGIRADDLYSVYMGLLRTYKYVVIDAGSQLTENTVTLMDSSDKILVITSPDMASLHDTSQFVQLSRSLGYPADKLMVVLNRAGLLGGIRSADIETALHHIVFATIPDDAGSPLRSLNRGIPLIVQYPNSPASKAIKQTAKKLAGLTTNEKGSGAEKAPAGKAQRDALLASSQLG